MEVAHSSGTPSTRERPRWTRSCSSASRPSMSRVPANASASCSPRYPSKGCACIQRWSPGCRRLCPIGVHNHPLPPRQAGTLGSSHQIACLPLLEHSRRSPSPSRPGRLAAVSSSTWPCRPRSRLTCAPLFCALVIRGALFARRSAIRLFRFTHVLCPPHLGRPLPPTSRSDASPASQRCREGRLRSLPSHLSSARSMGIPPVARPSMLPCPKELR